MANALGAKVYPNAVKEIGWFPIMGQEGKSQSGSFQFPPALKFSTGTVKPLIYPQGQS
ncbi:hypothetical protein NON20_07035 [Synechocystis sp. B12]|nr:hypothetical protein NON20_07035 [Synechocystis sp. B12]